MKKSFLSTRELVFCALCIAAAEVMRFPGLELDIGGQDNLRMNLGGIFYFLPSVMYGPLVGGITCAVYDFLGTIIKPSVFGWNPVFTITSFLGGGLRGFLWNYINKFSKSVNNIHNSKYNKFSFNLLLTLLISGIIVTILNGFTIVYSYGIKMSFILFFALRLLKEIILNVLITFVLSFILPKLKFLETIK